MSNSDWPISPVYTEHLETPATAVEIFAFSLDVDAPTATAAEALLNEEERQRAARFAQARDRRRYAVSRATLRQVLAKQLAVDPASVAFRYSPQGKPELTTTHARTDVRFNLSHSDEMVAVAIARGHPVGIDIERVRDMADAERVAGQFFSRQENEALHAITPEQRRLGFFNCWTRKEAFVKALGSGLGYALDSFDVSLAPGEAARILRLPADHGDDGDWHIAAFAPSEGYVGAVVVDGRASAGRAT